MKTLPSCTLFFPYTTLFRSISRRGFRPRKAPAKGPNPLELLPDIGERRLKSMDEAGITVQVLSNSGPGPDLVHLNRSEEHTSELQSRRDLVCRLLLEKKNK